MTPFLHGTRPRLNHKVPLWVAVVSGLGGVLLVIGSAVVFTLLGGPVTISFGDPDLAPAAPFVAPVETTAAARPTTPPVGAVTPSATAAGPPTPTASRVTGDRPPTYLKTLDTPTGGISQARPQTMNGQRYEEGFKLYCSSTNSSPSPTSWKVSGSSRFTSVFGIADDEESALNVVARVSIQDETGANLVAPFEVSLGRPRTVDIAITGIVQLQVFGGCRNSQTGRGDDSYLTLGDAALR